VFCVISVYFNIRNTLPKYYTFLPGHPVYSSVCCVGKFGLGYNVFVEVRCGTACRWMTGGVTT
jgi:hypothetical protein